MTVTETLEYLQRVTRGAEDPMTLVGRTYSTCHEMTGLTEVGIIGRVSVFRGISMIPLIGHGISYHHHPRDLTGGRSNTVTLRWKRFLKSDVVMVAEGFRLGDRVVV